MACAVCAEISSQVNKNILVMSKKFNLRFKGLATGITSPVVQNIALMTLLLRWLRQAPE